MRNGRANNERREMLEELMALYGPVMGGRDLRKTMGFKSGEAFRQAIHRNQVEVPLFTIPHRRGRFALTSDIAVWLTGLASRQGKSSGDEVREKGGRDVEWKESE